MNKFWLSIVATLILSGPVQAQFADQIDIPFTRYVLNNGLTLLVHEDHKAPIVAVNVWYHVGSKNEQPGRTGFAHLYEHLMYNGSENYNDEFFRPLDAAGATDRNGSTSSDYTNYYQTVPTSALDMVLWMESDRMGHLLGVIDQGRLDEQKGVVINELRQRYNNSPYGGAWDAILKGVYPEGHPYSWSPGGSEEDVENATLEDVRQWFETYYGPDNAVLTVAGDVDPEEVLEKVELYFGDIPPGPSLTRPKTWIPTHLESRRDVMEDDVAQARLDKVWATPPITDAESVLLEVASAVLGRGPNSRFYRRLVYDDQIATNVNAGQLGDEISGLFVIQTYVRPGTDMAVVEQALSEEIARFLDEGPSRDELERVKASYFARVARGLESVGGAGGKAQLLNMYEVLTGDAANINEDLRIYEEATARQVRDAARKWLSQGDYNLEIHPRPQYSVAATGADRTELPAPGDAPLVNFPDAEEFTLNNGMRVLLASYGSLPIVEMSMHIPRGYARDNSEPVGVASIVSSMLLEGAGSLSSLEIADLEERLGAQISARSTLDTTVVSLSALQANLEDSVDLFAEIIREPTFPEDELDRFRANALARIGREKSDPDSLVYRRLPELLYGDGHPYSVPFTGSGIEDSITNVQQSDLAAFHETWLQPDNATLVVVGNLTREDIEPILNRNFGSWRSSEQSRPEIGLSTNYEIPGGTIYLLDRPGASQSVIAGAQLLPPVQAGNTAVIEMAVRILGGSFTSRLNMNLREDKGWAYGASAGATNGRGERPLIYQASVQTDKTADSVMEIIREVSEYRSSNPATEDELERTREGILRSLPGNFEKSDDVLGVYESILRYGHPLDHIDIRQAEWRNMSVQDVQQAAREYLNPDRTIWLIVGDLAQIEQPLREANIGEVVVLDP